MINNLQLPLTTKFLVLSDFMTGLLTLVHLQKIQVNECHRLWFEILFMIYLVMLESRMLLEMDSVLHFSVCLYSVLDC